MSLFVNPSRNPLRTNRSNQRDLHAEKFNQHESDALQFFKVSDPAFFQTKRGEELLKRLDNFHRVDAHRMGSIYEQFQKQDLLFKEYNTLDAPSRMFCGVEGLKTKEGQALFRKLLQGSLKQTYHGLNLGQMCLLQNCREGFRWWLDQARGELDAAEFASFESKLTNWELEVVHESLRQARNLPDVCQSMTSLEHTKANEETREVLGGIAARFPDLNDLSESSIAMYLKCLSQFREWKLGYRDEQLREEVSKIIRLIPYGNELAMSVHFRLIASFYLSESQIALIPDKLQVSFIPLLPALRMPVEADSLWKLCCLCLLEPECASFDRKVLYEKMDDEHKQKIQADYPFEFLRFYYPEAVLPAFTARHSYQEMAMATAVDALVSQPLKMNSGNQENLKQVLSKFFAKCQVPLQFFAYTRELTDEMFTGDLDLAIIGGFIQRAKPHAIKEVVSAKSDDAEFRSHWPEFLMLYPSLARLFFSAAMSQTKIDFFTRGGSYHNYAQVQEFIIGNRSMPLQPDHGSLGLELRSALSNLSTEPLSPLNLDVLKDASQVTMYGRTAVTHCPPLIRCYKFQRKNESSLTFRTEGVVLKVLRANNAMRSRYPQPMGIYTGINAPKWLIDASVYTGVEQEVLVYDAEPGYFTYLHEGRLLQAEWKLARDMWLNDFARMAQGGFYLVVAPFFHCGHAGRAYLPMPDVFFDGKKLTRGTGGAGHCERAFEQADYPNVGQTGARDVGDFIKYEDAISDPAVFSSDILPTLGKTTRNLIVSNALARALLVDSILLVKRHKELGTLNWRDESIVKETALALAEGAGQILAGYVGKKQDRCVQFVREGIIDWELAARQLLFWSQNDAQGYVPFVVKGTVPSNLYENTVTIKVANNDRNFNEIRGFETRMAQDLAPSNGPLGLDALEKSWYLITGFAIALRNEN